MRRKCASPKTTTWSTHSRRIEPISLSAKPFCQGEPGAIAAWCGRGSSCFSQRVPPSNVCHRGNSPMTNEAEKRSKLIRHLEDALALADEIEDGHTGFVIERALDEARSRQFRPIG